MPVNNKKGPKALYQRNQYAKGGIGRRYWDFRDSVVFSSLGIRDQSVADIGCGEGITLEKAIRSFPEKAFWGVDPLRENLLICAGSGLPVVGGDVYRLPFTNGRFDCVLLLEVIEHLAKPETAIDEIKRILRPAGKLIMIFPNDKIFQFTRIVTGKFQEAFYDPGHLKQWTPKDIKSFLRHHDFRIVRQKSIPFPLWCLSLHHMVVCEKIA
jgi:ubiquinone/menaquinone biosynthesis C-methylase UbiE